MVSQQMTVVRNLLFKLSEVSHVECDDERALLHSLISEIQELECIDLRFSVWSGVQNLGDDQLLVLVNAMQDADLSNLKILNLSGCFFECHRVVTMLAELMESGSMPSMRFLDLSGHYSVGEEGSFALARMLKTGKVSTLQHLGLPRCDIDAIVGAIEEGQLRHLKSLVFSGMMDSPKLDRTSTSIPKLLQTGQLSQLQKLVLMSISSNPEGMATIAKALRSPQNCLLEHLDLSSNDLGDQGCVALAGLLKSGNLAQLLRLRLYSCSISSQQLEIIFQALESVQTCSSLRHLDLSWNNFGDEGASEVAAVIRRGCLSGLRRLNLGQCSIAAGGVVAIVESLGVASMLHLEWLNLLGNRIGAEGATAVANSFAGVLDLLPRLETVNLIDVRQGNAALFQALKDVVTQSNLQSNFTAQHCGLKRRTRPPFWEE